MTTRALLACCIAAALMSACSTAPKPLRGEFANIAPNEASSAERVGDKVRWGGEIVAIETLAGSSCFELLGKPLGDSARPTRADQTAGRFLACRDGFYDPALFEVGRDLTVVGTIEAIEPRPIGGFEYRYPKVKAEVIYLWPEHSTLRRPVGYWVGHHGNAWVGFWSPVYLPY